MTAGVRRPSRTWVVEPGKLAMLVLLALAIVGNALGSLGDLPEGGAGSAAGIAVLARRGLLLAFYTLLVAFYLVRSAAGSTSRSLAARAGALAGTFLPFLIPAVLRPSDRLATLVVANSISAAGLAWSVWSLRHLGRCISVVPEARHLVQTGPYRVVRHPLYLGELVATLGIVLGGFTFAALAAWAVLVGLQLFRASQEEKLLAGAFPEYDGYRSGTARVIPCVY